MRETRRGALAPAGSRLREAGAERRGKGRADPGGGARDLVGREDRGPAREVGARVVGGGRVWDSHPPDVIGRAGPVSDLSPRERLRLELPELYATVLERLAEVLHGPDPEAALNQFWKAVDQAYGKPTESVQVSAGPIPEAELATWSDEKIAARLAELEATSRQAENE